MGFVDDLRNQTKTEKQKDAEEYAQELANVSITANRIIAFFENECMKAARMGEKTASIVTQSNYGDDDVNYDTAYLGIANKVGFAVENELSKKGFKKLDVGLLKYTRDVSLYRPSSFFRKGGYKEYEVTYYAITIKAKW